MAAEEQRTMDLRSSLRCLFGHDWEWRIDDQSKEHSDYSDAYRDVWAKCRRCGRSKFLHSGEFVFRTYNTPNPLVRWTGCTFEGDPPRPFVNWVEWMQTRDYMNVTIRASDSASPQQSVTK